jgi:serine/threonine protein kinase/WD40 repeat protein
MAAWNPRANEIFLTALEIDPPAARQAHLDAACRGNQELRLRVEALLKAHGDAGGFLEPPIDPKVTGAFTPMPGASEVPVSRAEHAGERIGPYKLLQLLGEGGMGSVWAAEQSEPVKRRVALKVIKAGMDSTHVLRRFEAERQALALMEHQNIAKVLDAGTTPQGRPYFAMELIKGIPITKFCDQVRLTLRERLELLIPVCLAVQHAHQKGIIHRDLKPSNVLIALFDGKPVPKIIDFGVAKATSQRLTEQTMYTEIGQIVGTLEYMAPEQAELNNLDIDTRADIYSLGVILYELLSGSPPFTAKELRGAAFTEMLRMIREVEPPKLGTKISSSNSLPAIAAVRRTEPRKLAQIVRGELDWITMKALEKDRSRRYETANGLAMDIQRYLNDEPLAASPPSAGYRLQKFVRRHRGRVLAASIVLLTLVAGLATSLTMLAWTKTAEANLQTSLDKERTALENESTERQRANAAAAEATAIAAKETEARQKIEALGRENVRRIVRYYVATGSNHADAGDLWPALTWYAQAWANDPDPANEPAHRLRLAATFGQLPKLSASFFHAQQAFDAVVSPNGTRLVALLDSPVAWLYDTSSQAPVARMAHAGTVLAAAFTHDGRTLATASTDGTVAFWSAADGAPQGDPLRLAGPARSIAFHPSRPLLAVASGNAVPEVWDVSTRTRVAIAHPLASDASKATPFYVSYSDDGKRLIAAAANARPAQGKASAQFQVFDAESGTPLSPVLQYFPSSQIQVTPCRDKSFPAVAHDGRRAVAWVGDQYALVDVSNGESIVPLKGLKNREQLSVGFSADDSRVFATNGISTILRVFDAETGNVVRTLAHPRAVLQAAWHPDGKRILSASAGGEVRLWDAEAGSELIPVLKHGVSNSRVGWTADGRKALVADLDGTVRLWDFERDDGRPRPYDWADLPDAAARRRRDGSTALVAPAGAGIVVLAPDKKVVVATPGLTVRPANDWIANASPGFFTPDGRFVLGWAGDSPGRLWRTDTGAEVPTVRYAIPSPWKMAVTPDGSRAVAVDRAGRAQVFEVATGKLVGRKVDTTPTEPVPQGPAIAPDATLFARLESLNTLGIYDVASGRQLARVSQAYELMHFEFSPDSRRIATCGLDQTARVWDAKSGVPVSPQLRHRGYVNSVAFGPDGHWLATSGNDKRIHLWDIRTGDPLVPPIVHDRVVNGAWFRDDGKAVIVHDTANRFFIWEMPQLTVPTHDVLPLVRLYTGTLVDDTGGISNLPYDEFEQNLDAFRQSWFASLQKDVPALPPATQLPTDAVTAIDPENARQHLGKLVAVQLTVASMGGNTHLHLNSLADYTKPGNFVVIVMNGMKRQAEFGLENLPTGSVVRATGIIGKFNNSGNLLCLRINEPSQLVVISKGKGGGEK